MKTLSLLCGVSMHLKLVLAASVLLVACGSESTPHPPPAPEAPAAEARGIAWFEGSVDDAFELARESRKPVFLYWGAEWCPPCHAIAATIFAKPEFIERSRLFVPVYLDGDEPHAQEYGEKFDVLGYPTMIVFSPDGVEITRIPGGIDIEAYGNILDTTLTATSSADALLERLMDSAGRMQEEECSILAYHAWSQDPETSKAYDMTAAFRRMYDACPATLPTERSVLYLSWLDALMDESSGADGELVLSDKERQEALAVLQSVLADPAQVRANIFAVVIGGARYVKFLTEPGSAERVALVDAFHDTLDAVAADETVYKRERIYTLAGKIRFERLDDDSVAVSDGLQQEIRDMVVWADESTPSVYERQPVINALANVLAEAGMGDVARPLLLAELDKSKQPYYFMVSLADIEQDAGNHDAALDWLRKAYEATTGPATRFQWGYYYVNGLIEMTPDDTQRIEDSTVALIGELLQRSRGFYQRPKGQLERLENTLRDWGAERKAALAGIRESVQAICATLPARDASCDAFLQTT